MKTYIWQYLDGITDQYHDGGGLVIITEQTPDYEWKAYKSRMVNDTDEWEAERWEQLRDDLPEPDISYQCELAFPQVIVFGDNGCC